MRASLEEDDHRGVIHGPTYNVPPNTVATGASQTIGPALSRAATTQRTEDTMTKGRRRKDIASKRFDVGDVASVSIIETNVGIPAQDYTGRREKDLKAFSLLTRNFH